MAYFGLLAVGLNVHSPNQVSVVFGKYAKIERWIFATHLMCEVTSCESIGHFGSVYDGYNPKVARPVLDSDGDVPVGFMTGFVAKRPRSSPWRE
ncbi:MAG: hypothetical protein Q9191_001927 [Dirinaria sp. TL-2023a]